MVKVIDPLVVDLGMSEFVDAFDVVRGLLVLLFVVETPRMCVVSELAQEVLSFVRGAQGLVVGV